MRVLHKFSWYYKYLSIINTRKVSTCQFIPIANYQLKTLKLSLSRKFLYITAIYNYAYLTQSDKMQTYSFYKFEPNSYIAFFLDGYWWWYLCTGNITIVGEIYLLDAQSHANHASSLSDRVIYMRSARWCVYIFHILLNVVKRKWLCSPEYLFHYCHEHGKKTWL